MDAVEFVKGKARMTNACSMNCFDCPLSQNKNDKNVLCGILQRDYPEYTVEIVEKWSKENPEEEE